MDKYNFSEATRGGILITLNDFEFEQLGKDDALKGIALGLCNGKSGVVLSGCVQTTVGGGEQVTDGYVLIDGEVCKHDLTVYPSIMFEADGLKWDVAETYDPSGNKTTLLPSTVDTRVYRRAVLSGYMGSEPDNSYKSLKLMLQDQLLLNANLGFALWPALNDAQTAWTNCVLSSNWSVTAGGVAKYRVTKDQYVEVVLNVQQDSAGTALIFTLPNTAWPSTKYAFVAISTSGNVEVHLNNANGQLTIPGGGVTLGAAYKLYFKIPLTT